MRQATRAGELYARALELIPGGVNSPVRAMKAVGLDEPLFARRGEGAYLEDADGRRYVDWVLSWGPLLFGHADPETVEAVTVAAREGTSFGAATEREVELAEEICRAVPSVEQVRLVSSGTEAAMSALRLARAATGRDRLVRFAGCYHGHADAFLAEAGSGVATLGIPSSPGVPAAVVAATAVVPYNDLDSAERVVEGAACVFVEPVAGNMGVVPPEPGFLEGLRRLCDESGALLVFDEVITGFRVARGGAQERFGVLPDLTVLGKIVGGGLPLGAFGGPAELMELLAPAGEVYQAGTLSGNPLATAAGLSVLRRLDDGVYEELERRGARLEQGLREAAPGWCVQRVGAMATLFTRPGPVRNLDDARASDTGRYGELFRGLLERGIYIAPSQFEALFLSLAHGDEEVEFTLEAVAGLLA
ncbi:MAG TPA: glutamate-1-semialdehyde 2,1-aminomutase [Gaiellaceae bacterium]